jgi:hypothetical protein
MRYALMFFIIVFLSCSANKKTYKQFNLECYTEKKNDLPCDWLSLLSDSVRFSKYFVDTTNRENAKVKENCFNDIIIKLFKGSQMEPNWSCSFPLCSYNSFSLHKSIYKTDILRLMRFYKCADTIRLQSLTKGSFSNQELKIIENQNRFSIVIDTMILYGK